MNVGAFIPTTPPNAEGSFLQLIGPTLEERGFESVWVPEHTLGFDDYTSQYPYAEDGRFPGGSSAGLLEPFTVLSYLAATTKLLRLATGICILAQRNPVYTAKQVADLDVLSGGRVELGVGAGWLREEFDALGVPFERRGDRTRDYVQVMKTLWQDGSSCYDGKFYRLPNCHMFPKPLQRPHPNVHFGGDSDSALRRVADLGQGWLGFDYAVDDLPPVFDRLDQFLSGNHRSRADISLSICPKGGRVDASSIEGFAELGVDRLIVTIFAGNRDQLLTHLDSLFSNVVMPASRL